MARLTDRIAAANAGALDRLARAAPVLSSVRDARTLVPALLERLRWIRAVLGPAIDAALQNLGGLPLIPLMTRALAMGDEMHQRNIAATALFVRALAPHVVEAALPAATVAAVLRFLADNDQFFLNVAMAACKCVADGRRDIPSFTCVTALGRNGVEFGLRVSGLGAAWVTAPAPVPDG